MIDLGMYRLSEDVKIPTFGTKMSTCFDLHYFPTNKIVNGYSEFNIPVERFIESDKGLYIAPGERLLVPTGLVMKIQKNLSIETFGDIMDHSEPLGQYSIRLHPRSGLSLKRGLVLANSEGVIDVDYQQEVFVLMTNISKILQTIAYQERIAQGEVVVNEGVRLTVLNEMPTQYSERDGGFGSTGTV
jgi:dUTP pyrophosphatase